MTYTKIAKPTNGSYTNVNFVGKQQYDQASIAYDDASVFFDGMDVSAYTKVAKPDYGLSPFVGLATGLLIPPTYNQQVSLSRYTKVPKPS